MKLIAHSMANSLGIIYVPNVADVVGNVRNICNGRHADDSLFDNYPRDLFPPTESDDLLSVMCENLKALNKFVNDPEIESLAKLPCIPVYCDLLNRDPRKVVLVKPSCVIDAYSYVMKEYHPLLLSLPTELNSYSQLVAKVGVKKNLELQHMQILLEKNYTRCPGGKLEDPNSQNYVSNAIRHIHSHLGSETEAHGESFVSSSLTPLYLPDTNNVLKKSTDMIYRDNASFFGPADFDLSATNYAHFDISITGPYKVSAVVLCELLPNQVRPLGMSKILKQVPDSDCESVENSELSLKVRTTIWTQVIQS